MSGEESVSKQGIPAAEVLIEEDVPAYLKREGDVTAEEGVKRMDLLYKKYKRVEQQMLSQKQRLISMLPELDLSLNALKFLEEKKTKDEGFDMTYSLNEQVYCKAHANTPDKVLLWLGANVMLEFTLDEAREILQQNYQRTTDAIEDLNKELSFVKDQITTTEVNVAHIYNYGVQQRKKQNQSRC